MVSGTEKRPQIEVSPPTFEQHHDGIGVNFARPRISWRYSCASEDVHDWEQCAYELEIRDESADQVEKFYVESHDNVLESWPKACPSLRSRDRRSVRVRCYGTSTEGDQEAVDIGITKWSDWSVVEAALLDRDDWSAQMITAKDPVSTNEDGSARPLCFRKSFEVPSTVSKIGRARLYVTGFGVYSARINGEIVGDHEMAPGWQSYRHRLHYQVFDVARLLETQSENVIGIEVGPGWFASALSWANRRFTYGDELGVLAQLEITFEGRESPVTICTDDSWTCTTSAVLSSEIYAGEVYDQRVARSQDGWDTFSSFDSSRWLPTKARAKVEGSLISPNTPPVRVTQRIAPIKLFRSPSAKLLIDFGQNLVGRLRVKRLRRDPGTRVIFRHAEVLENGELGTRPLRGAQATDTVICDGSLLTDWSPRYTFHGFRFVEVTGWPGEDEEGDELLTLRSLYAEVMHTDLQRTGWFSCSNEDVNKLHENARWSMRGNFLSVPTDCPQRDERLGWTGDLNMFTPSANFYYDTAGMLGNWLEDLTVDQFEEGELKQNGMVPFVVPNAIIKNKPEDPFWTPYPNAVWGDVAIMTPWALFGMTADLDILRRQYKSMTGYLSKGVGRGDDDLWDPWIGQFGDWLDPTAPTNDSGNGRTDGTYVADAFLIHVTNLMARIAHVLGHHSDAKKYEDDHKRLKNRFHTKYVSPFGLVICDTQTALSLAIMFDIIDDPFQRLNAAVRLSRAVQHSGFRIATGFAGTPYIPHVLTRTDQANMAYRMLLETECPSWLYPVRMGATTIWERWDSMLPDGSINPGSMTSFNHYALGAVVNWLHEAVGGISAIGPGWRTFKVQPVIPSNGELSHAEVTYESRYGRVECCWKIEQSDEGESVSKVFKLFLLVPPNSRARVILPGEKGDAVAGSGEVPRAEEDRDDGDKARWVGSGRHVFEHQL